MIRALIVGGALGFFAGLVPGPYTTLVVATVLRGGFRAGVRLMAVPLVSEMLVLSATALFLAQLPSQALRWMGLAGGALIAGMAWRTWRQASDIGSEDRDEGTDAPERLLEGVTLAVLSPVPWVFWFLLGAPLFLNFRAAGWLYGIGFAVSYVVAFVLGLVVLALIAHYGQSALGTRWRRRIVRGTAVFLVGAGAVLVWQSWAGNFHRMVEGSLDLTDTVERAIEDGT